MRTLNDFRELIWPILEGEINDSIEEIQPKTINIQDEFLDKTIEYALKLYNEENERKKTIESKSSLFIGTITVLSTILIAVTTIIVKEQVVNVFSFSLVFILFIITIYMARTILFSIKALERKSYHSISIDDFFNSKKTGEYQKIVVSNIVNKIKNNHATINEKVDNMVMAQEYFKRVIFMMCIYSGILLALMTYVLMFE